MRALQKDNDHCIKLFEEQLIKVKSELDAKIS